MAASRMDRFSWSRADVVIEVALPEWEGRVETKTLEDVHVVASTGRRQGWLVRAFDHRGRQLDQLAISSSIAERGKATCAALYETWRITKRGDCGC